MRRARQSMADSGRGRGGCNHPREKGSLEKWTEARPGRWMYRHRRFTLASALRWAPCGCCSAKSQCFGGERIMHLDYYTSNDRLTMGIGANLGAKLMPFGVFSEGTKYIAVCKTHNFEGMRRDQMGEAALDLSGHMELFPDETHLGATIIVEPSESQGGDKSSSLNDRPKRGSDHLRCEKKKKGKWHKKGRFDLGEFGGRVEVKAIPGKHIFDEKLTCTNVDGREFTFTDIRGMFSEKKELPPGRYTMDVSYRWSEFSGRRTEATITYFVHWIPFEEQQEW